ncbi:MAG: histidine phosphatase family protein [Chloroflexi bacterium]|nr:histidine phosphatase family protein [Chloroflexota bacterium]
MSAHDKAITLHLVRHGETAWNAERRFQTPEVPLSDVGRSQAATVSQALAQLLGERTNGEVALLSSDYARTMETASIISDRLNLPVLPEPLLRERNFGVARGQLYADIGEETIASWRDPFVRIEGGESWADVFERVDALLSRLRAEPPARELVLVTHGGTMNVMLQRLAGAEIDAFKLTSLENCALRTVEVGIRNLHSGFGTGT